MSTPISNTTHTNKNPNGFPEAISGSEPFDCLVSRLTARACEPKIKSDGKGTSRCPGHDDTTPSLSFGRGSKGQVLVKCFAGCETDAILAALGLTRSDLRIKRVIPRRESAIVQADGCDLATYASVKKLPVDFLIGLGLSDCKRSGKPAVRIPYKDAAGLEFAQRYRLSMAGEPRFQWNKGAKLSLYGLWRQASGPKPDSIVLVEGESDAQTLWFHGIAALGVPGASTWKEPWTEFLEGIETVYVFVEPGDSGKAFTKAISKTSIRDRVRLVRFPSAKDPSELHQADPLGFPAAWQSAVEESTSWDALARAESESRSRDAWERCKSLASQSRILDAVNVALERAGVVGESSALRILYLAIISRFLDHPVCVVVKGPSSVGKSFLVQSILKLFPETAYYELSATSEKALIYSEEPLAHRMLVIYEAAALHSDLATYLMRSLISEGRVRYETVEKTVDGLRPRFVEREGPTALLVTTTSIQLDRELETRLLSVTISDTPGQTAKVMAALAVECDTQASRFPEWHALQDWLAGANHEVTIPFAGDLARLIRPAAVRLRRDFMTTLILIKAHAVLHQVSRARDSRGRIVAELEDYAVIRELIAGIVAEGVNAKLPETIRETVRAVRDLKESGIDEPNVKKVAGRLGLDESSAYRRVRRAINLGYLRNLESKRGLPARLVVGDPLPEEADILPSVEAVEALGISGTVCAREVGGS